MIDFASKQLGQFLRFMHFAVKMKYCVYFSIVR